MYDRQLALLYTDHGRPPGEAVVLAERELAVRKDVSGWDASAWALYRAGHFAEALEISPAFDPIQARVARRALKTLGGS
jgi:hypothetical protein